MAIAAAASLPHASNLNNFIHLLHVRRGVGDKLVLLADVDKHSATDLVKLLNR